MHLYLLWGNSLSNKERTQELARALSFDFSEVNAWTYQHRVDTSKSIDTRYEAKKIYDSLPDNRQIGIVAKSAGCLVALEAMKHFELRPDLVLFTGFPIRFATETLGRDLTKTLKEISYDQPIHIVQQTKDPAGTPEEVTQCFSNGSLQTIGHFYEWDSHYYEVKAVQNIIQEINKKEL